MVPRSGWTASWPPSSLPIAHGIRRRSGARCQRVVAALAMHFADRVDRWQVHHVEAHLGDPRKRLYRGRQGPVHRFALGIPPAGGPRKHLVPRTEPGQRAVHPHPVHLTAGQQFAQRVLFQQFGDLPGGCRVDAGRRVTGSGQRRRRLQQRVAQFARQAHGGAPEQLRADHEVVGQLGFTLSGFEFRGDRVSPRADRIAPAIHPEGPQTDTVRGELTVEHVWRPARRHRDQNRLDALRSAARGAAACSSRERLIAAACSSRERLIAGRHFSVGGTRKPRVAPTQVADHQGRRDRLVALAPHRGPDRHHLADHGLGRIPSAGDDGPHIVDLDATGHPILLR